MSAAEWMDTRGDTIRILRWGYHMGVGGGGWIPFWLTVDQLRYPAVFL